MLALALVLALASLLSAVGAVVSQASKHNFASFTVLAAFFLTFAIVLLLTALYQHYQWLFTIDSQKIESRRGIIGRDVRSIRTKDLRNIHVRQSFFHRIINVGNVEFSSAAGADVEVVFYGVSDPMTIKEKVQQLQAAA